LAAEYIVRAAEIEDADIESKDAAFSGSRTCFALQN
jgi:hypothetical protein